MSVKKITHESNHWIQQRLSAIAILFFILSIIFAKKEDIIYLLVPINIICIYHGRLGMEIIIEDYMKPSKKRSYLIKSINIFSKLSIIISFFIMFYTHITFLKLNNLSMLFFLGGTFIVVLLLYFKLKFKLIRNSL